MNSSVIGFIGLGTMGAPMAERLIRSGRTLIVFDKSKSAIDALTEVGALRGDSPLHVASHAETIFTCLPTPGIVMDVILGPNGVSRGSHVRNIVDLSTTGPNAAKTIASALLGAGSIDMIDAPVSGGQAGAREGKLTLMASGLRSAYEAVAPHLTILGRSVYCGEAVGLGQTLKIINNLMSVVALAITSEAFALGMRCGLDARLMIDVLNTSSGRNSATIDKFPNHVLNRRFDFGFPLSLSMKDVDLCLEEARRLNVPMPMGSTVRQILSITGAEAGIDADFTTIALTLEKWANTKIEF